MVAVATHAVRRFRDGVVTETHDVVAREEPLEIRLEHGPTGDRRTTSVGITMRTPGDEADLAVGLLVSEGVLRRRDQLADVTLCAPRPPATTANVVRVALAPDVVADLGGLARHGTTTSACGLCGKASLDAVSARGAPVLGAGPRLDARVVSLLPDRLRAAQATFAQTGGLHAAGLFTADGDLLVAREDVGRHNAVDKVVGACFREGASPVHDRVLQVSGRASFELVQKAVMAGIPVLAAVGAPSSLAVELAEAHGLTLLGFVRDGGFVAYGGLQRLH